MLKPPPDNLYPPTVTPPDQPLPLWRFLPAFLRNPLRSLPRQAYENDSVVLASGGRTRIVWVSAPHLVEQVLHADAAHVHKSAVEKRLFNASLSGSVLISEGSDWRWQRRALAPLFRPTDIEAYLPAMTAAADAQVARWQYGRPAKVRPIDRDMLRATYDIILATMLVGGRPAEADALLAGGEAYLARVSWEMASALLGLPTWVPHPATLQMRAAARQMRDAVSELLARRRAQGGAPSDLLGRLLAARHPDTGEPMSDQLVISNLLTLLEAGHETTAKALTWTLYLLARAPGWQAQVHEEIRRVVGDQGITVDHLDQLVLTRRVIKEALRLYPPAPVMAREVIEPLELDGLAVPKGAQIVIAIFAIHRHRKLWADPDKFDPDRFLPGAEAGRPRAQYMPFGGGPRVCIGATFAMTEAMALLATFVRAARFDWDGHHAPEPISRVTLRPEGGMPLIVTMR